MRSVSAIYKKLPRKDQALLLKALTDEIALITRLVVSAQREEIAAKKEQLKGLQKLKRLKEIGELKTFAEAEGGETGAETEFAQPQWAGESPQWPEEDSGPPPQRPPEKVPPGRKKTYFNTWLYGGDAI